MDTVRAIDTHKGSECGLVAAAKCGDAQAFQELVVRYERKVLATALRITNNREDAEDVVQESLHKAYRHLPRFEGKSLFSTWLMRITMNQAFMLLRRRRKVAEVSPESLDDSVRPVAPAFVDQRPSPEESCWRRERTRLLTEAIGHLGPTIRRTMFLRIVEERSLQETAQILGISTAAVKSRLFHGRQRLRGTVTKVFAARRGRFCVWLRATAD